MNDARFTSSSLIFISFVCLITWAWISTVILNRNSDGVIPVTKLSEKVLYVSYLSIMWALGFFVGTVYQCKKVSFYSIFLWVFKIINSSDFYQMIFAFIEIIIWFFFILLMLWFTLIDFFIIIPTLHFWNKLKLVIIYYTFFYSNEFTFSQHDFMDFYIYIRGRLVYDISFLRVLVSRLCWPFKMIWEQFSSFSIL